MERGRWVDADQRQTPLSRRAAKGNWKAIARKKDGAPVADIVAMDRERPPCPDWVCPRGHQEWSWFVDNVDTLNVYAESDYNSLATGANVFGMMIECELKNQREGYYTIGKDGVSRLTAWAKNAKVYHDKWHKWAREFGLTPSARADVRVVKNAKKTSAGKSKKEQFG